MNTGQSDIDLEKVISMLEAVYESLRYAEGVWVEALEQACEAWQACADYHRLDDLLHTATHETASALSFCLHDIRVLRARLSVRAAYPLFPAEVQDRILDEGWSTSLVHELHAQYPQMSLVELSERVKSFHRAWSALPDLLARHVEAKSQS